MKTLLHKLLAHTSSPKRRPEPRRALPQVEGLEERRVMTVSFHGGSVLLNVEATPIFYGSGWTSDGNRQDDAAYMTSFLGDVVNSPYMDMLGNAGYSDAAGNPIGRGSADPATFIPDTLDTTQTLTDATIQSTLQGWINNNGQFAGLQPDANRLYVIYVEPGVVVADASGNSSGNGTGNLLAYHGSFAGQDAFKSGINIHYVVVPYADGAVNNALSWLSTRDSMTSSTSHELAEAVTDPDVSLDANGTWHGSGWHDGPTGGTVLGNEIGEAGLTANQQVYVDGYAVQRVADQNDQPMTPYDATAARPVTFLLQNKIVPFTYQLWPGGPYRTSYVQSNELYENANGAMLPVTYSNGNPVMGVKSISDQGIDAQGNAMIDVVLKDGSAYEVHDQYNATQQTFPVYLGGNVQDAKAGQGVSYVLFNNGYVQEYFDANGATRGIDNGVTAIDAGTDRYGVNMEAEIWQGQVWIYSDSTGWDFTGWQAYGFNAPVQVSAGRQGVIGFVDSFGHSWDWSEATGQANELDSGVTKITIGYDQNGGTVIDELFSNGNLWDWRAGSGWKFLGYQGSTISKARAGVVDDVLSTGDLYQFDPWFNASLLATDIQQVA